MPGLCSKAGNPDKIWLVMLRRARPAEASLPFETRPSLHKRTRGDIYTDAKENDKHHPKSAYEDPSCMD